MTRRGNIQLCVLGMELDFVKVLDFGLVKDRRGGFEAGLTMDGAVQGTPAYLAPEAGDSPMTMMAAHVRKPVEAPSSRTELPIPAALEELVLALLAKDPADRPQSAEEVMRRLDEIELPASWSRARAERWWQVHLPQALQAAGRAQAPLPTPGKPPLPRLPRSEPADAIAAALAAANRSLA